MIMTRAFSPPSSLLPPLDGDAETEGRAGERGGEERRGRGGAPQRAEQERKLDERRAEDSVGEGRSTSAGEGRKSLKTFQDKRVVRIRESKNMSFSS